MPILFAAPIPLSAAVAPFANLSGVKAEDYLGFKIAEPVSGGLAGYPGVSVVERGAIDSIIQEH
jgi:TolB-like protein